MNLTKILHSFFLLIFLYINTSIGLAQTCLPNGITLSSQQEVDDFASNYPGCIEIEGVLQIGESGSNDISNLDKLSELKYVGGLTISSCSFLSDLNGLSSLEGINGTFQIFYNTGLTSLNGLRSLSYINNDFGISLNDGLIDLEGLSSLETINGNTSIINNENLKNLNGLTKLNTIKGDLVIADNRDLENLEGLSSLQTIMGELRILENQNLSSIHGLEKLEQINGSLRIYNNDNLINLVGLSKLHTINSSLIIERNDSLKNLKGLNSLINIRLSLIITSNDNLASLNLFNTLEFVGEDIEIGFNHKLSDLSGFSCFNFVGTESLSILGNNKLESLEGLEHLELSYLNNLTIAFNQTLNKCAVESICNYISAGKTIFIANYQGDCLDNESLENSCQNFSKTELPCKGVPFPNPTNDYLILECACDHNYSIKYKIFNTSAQLIRSGIFNNYFLNVSTLSPGTYLIKFEDGREIDLNYTFVKK